MPILSSPLDLMAFKGKSKHIIVAKIHRDKYGKLDRFYAVWQLSFPFVRPSLITDAEVPSEELLSTCAQFGVGMGNNYEPKACGPFWNHFVYTFRANKQHWFITTDGESLCVDYAYKFCTEETVAMLRTGDITPFDVQRLLCV